MQLDVLNIGLIEDDSVMGGSIVQRLELEGYAVRWWQTGQEALQANGKIFGDLDLVLCDIRLSDMNGEEIYRCLMREKAVPPFIFITGYGEIDQAVRLMRLGAADYVTKPFRFDDFLSRVRDHARSHSPTQRIETTLGVSPSMQELEALLQRYSNTDLPVLITGETGVGKEVTSRLLHKRSPFANGPFMAVNCAAIPGELLESEIFGHERGAFTGAEKQHHGYAERTKRGTLFLDEVGDMPLALQAKILRLVEERKFFRVGGEVPIPFEGRIVAATHQDLLSGKGRGSFREDLYYRLAVLPLHIPPLRKRPEDIRRFMKLFLDEASERQNRSFRGYSSLAEELAMDHPWRGNVRELRNRVERAVAVGNQEWIMPQDMFPDRVSEEYRDAGFESLSGIRDDAERRHIERALSMTDGQIAETARMLGISRTTLWEKMTRLGIQARRSEN